MFANNDTPKKLVGKPAPAFSLPNHDGSTFEFKPGSSGRPTAIFFYPQSGAWCYHIQCLSGGMLIGVFVHRDIWMYEGGVHF